MPWKKIIWLGLTPLAWAQHAPPSVQLGQEVSVPHHLQDDEEFQTPLSELIAYGKKLFAANWTWQEGAGRPLTKGTGKALSDPSQPLVGTRAFNRFSAPDANSCAGCHNMPYGLAGGRGDFVTNVFVLGQRFDFATFGEDKAIQTKDSADEHSQPVSMQTFANSRMTPGMFGAGYLEMLAREITDDLQRIRATIKPGQSRPLVSKGISFGVLSRSSDGLWVTSKVEGMSRLSLVSLDPVHPPSLVIRPWHQASNVVSLREFTNTAFNQHHGIQSTERFGLNVDQDGDGFVNELTRADVTAVSLFQATLQVPGRVIPRNPEVEQAVLRGEAVFSQIGCASCHRPSLPLDKADWTFTEPNPYNPELNLQRGQARSIGVDLTSDLLPQPRLKPSTPDAQVIQIPAFTDFKLHDITTGPDDPNAEPLDMNFFAWSPKFTAGNTRFLAKRLWDSGSGPPYFHNGLLTTMRQAILAHSGEALGERRAFEGLSDYDRNSVIEFLKTLQVLPAGVRERIVDENYHSRTWPPSQSLP